MILKKEYSSFRNPVDRNGNLRKFSCVNPHCVCYKGISQGGVFDNNGVPRCNFCKGKLEELEVEVKK